MASFVDSMQSYFKSNGKTREFAAHSSKVHSVAWNCDGRKLASGSYDKTVNVFHLERDRLSKDVTYRGHGDSVDQLCWHPKHSDLLVTASGDKTIRLWDARTSKSVATVNTKGENINICWSPDGSTIAVGNKDDLITFIDAKTHRSRLDQQYNFEVNEISWNNDGNLFFLTSGQGAIHILSYPELKTQHVLNAHPANCICIEFDPCGVYFATGSADALVSIWNLEELVCVRTLSRLDWPVRTISFSHDGKMLASASEDLVIDIAEVETAALKRQTKILKAFMRSDVDFALKQGSLTQSQDVSQTPAQDALPTEGQEGSPSADQDTPPTAGQDSSPTAGQQQVKIHHQQQVNACCHQLVKIHHHP